MTDAVARVSDEPEHDMACHVSPSNIRLPFCPFSFSSSSLFSILRKQATPSLPLVTLPTLFICKLQYSVCMTDLHAAATTA